MQPGHDFGAGPAELVTAVGQQPQRHRGVIGLDLPQTACSQRGHGEAVSVDRIGLTALTGGEHPSSRRQLRRHVDDGLAVSDQALGDMPADVVAAFDRPDPFAVLAAGGEHRLVAVVISAEPAAREDTLALVDDLDRGGSFVRVHSDDDLGHLPCPACSDLVSAGGQRYFELGIPLWSLSAPR